MTTEETTKEFALAYADEDSATAIEQIPNDKWDAVLEAGKLLHAPDIGIDCDVSITHEDLRGFFEASLPSAARARQGLKPGGWHECEERGSHDIGPHQCLLFWAMQLFKGHRRQSLAVLDLGDIRVCLTKDGSEGKFEVV